MSNFLERLFKIIRSNTNFFAQQLRDKFVSDDDADPLFHHQQSQNRYSSSSYQKSDFENGIPRQVIDDLAVFNLTPPSSFEEVRKARNREIKKYHSDKFQNDPDKLETSKQIMQIYNAAYSRLEAYYTKKGK